MAGPHAHDEKPKNVSKKLTEAEKAKEEAKKAKEEYASKMAEQGATLPKGFIKDAKANTGH